jgi:hypothetical protein
MSTPAFSSTSYLNRPDETALSAVAQNSLVDFEPGPAQSRAVTGLPRFEQSLVAALITADGEGIKVQPECLFGALRFAQSFPPVWPAPEVLVEPDGEIAFDWDFASRRVLTVNIRPDGYASFSALIGYEPTFGTVMLTGGVPDMIGFLMSRILPT